MDHAHPEPEAITENNRIMKKKIVSKANLLCLGEILLLCALAISFEQLPLYTSNQNTYFVHGLADAGAGHLETDWLAQTADPFPLFSALVSLTVRLFGENAFYLYQIILQGLYVYGILGIGSYLFRFERMGIQQLSFYALLAMLYSGWLTRLLLQLPGVWRLASYFDPNGLLTWGVAEQYIFGSYFQPSVFGVFMILSIYAFLRDKPFIAVLLLTTAAIFHFTYLLSAAMLTCIYMTVIARNEKNYRKALLVGATGLACVTPLLIYTWVNFAPTTAEISATAQSLLVEYRIPHHTIVANWFGKSTIIQIAIVAVAIFLARRTKMLPILLGSFLTAALLTVIQMLTCSKSLALLFPWRISVFLVPIASSILLAGIVSAIFKIRHLTRIGKPLQAVIILFAIALGYVGIRQTITLFDTPRAGLSALARFVANTYEPGNLYLIPPEMESFRLAARVPIFIDHKSHPYQDTEVIEWFQRVQIAQEFYAARGGTACSIIQELSEEYGVTHVVSRVPITDCTLLQEEYQDANSTVYKVQSPK